ncbi:MAG TPA: DUF1566 domain-containing protein [Fontimonas sp.]
MTVDLKAFSVPLLPVLCRTVILAATLWASISFGAESVGVLHDTGQTTCFAPDHSAVPCEEGTTGDTSSLPRQDARFGRDALAALGRLPKVGGGEYGFDYTRICASGDAEGAGSCPINPPLPADVERPAPGDWACTRDNVTGLMWSLGNLTGVSWEEASRTDEGSYIWRANSLARCGLSAGWRLPVRREGFSLKSYGRELPAIEPAFFPVLATDFMGLSYWTSDVYMRNPNLNYVLDLKFPTAGNIWCRYPVPGDFLCETSPAPNGRFDARVLLVNGTWQSASLSAGAPRWRVEDGLVVTDTATGLVWDRCAWGQTGPGCEGQGQVFHRWNDAMQVPTLANRGRHRGNNDWRIPNARELETLVKIDAVFPAIDATIFPNTAQEYHWTSTQRPVIPTISNQVYCVDFKEGNVSNCLKEEDTVLTPNRGPVRLVRGGNPYGMVDGISERLLLADFDAGTSP